MLYSNNIILVQLMKKTNMVSSYTFVQSVLESWFKGVNYISIVVRILHTLFMKVIFLFLWSVHSLSRDENFLNSLSTKHCRAHVSAWLWEGKAGLRCKCNEFQLHYNNSVGTTPNWQKVLSCTYFHEPEIQKSENLWIFTLFWTVCKIYKNRLEIIVLS